MSGAAGATVDNHDAGNANISQWGDGGKENQSLHMRKVLDSIM